MKKNILLLFAGLALAFTACQEETPESHLEETEHDAAQIEDGEADGVIEFNDGIVALIDLGELQMAKLMDLDAMDVTAEEMANGAAEAQAEVNASILTLENLKPVGPGGEEFLSAAVNHLNNVKMVAGIYADFAEDLEVPDSLWTEDMGTMWMNLAEPAFADYEDSYEQLEMEQANYGSLNQMDIIPSDVTIEELYEETK
jgi:hypothetical protein